MPPKSPSSSPEPARLRSVPIERDRPGSAAPGAHRVVPKPLTSLIGREADVAAVSALIIDRGVRLVTLTGPGGVGKTRLALRVSEALAAAFPDGVVFVPLAAIAGPDLVLPSIVRALGLREDATRSAADTIADAVRQRRLLLVLDNVEQVRASAAQLAALLEACPDLVMLITSRALLHVAGEQRYSVSPLALPESVPTDAGLSIAPHVAAASAVQLFVARARAIDPAFILDEGNAAAIAAICCRLDGLPLAIELAAPLLDEGPEDAPHRLRTMRASIAWSHDLLSPPEQALFRRLAIFVGGFTLEAAERVGRRGAGVGGTAERTSPDFRPPTPFSLSSPPSST